MSVILRWIVVAALVIGTMVLLSALLAGGMGPTRARLLVSLLFAVVIGGLAHLDLNAPKTREQRMLGWAGLGSLAIAGALSFLLTWMTGGAPGWLWRLWWVFGAMAVGVPHILTLLTVRREPWILWTRRVTLGAVVVSTCLLITMAARADVLSLPSAPPLWALVLSNAVGLLGSGVLVIWAREAPVPWWKRWPFLRPALAAALPVVVFAAGFYAGRLTTPAPSVLEASGGSALAILPPDEIQRQIHADLARLHAIVEQVERSRARADDVRRTIVERVRAEKRVFTPDEDDAVRALFFSFLSCRTALLRMIAFYHGFEQVRDPSLRAQCFLVGYAAGTACYSASLALVDTCADDDVVRAKLNEAEPRWGIPAGMLDRIHESVALDAHVELFKEMTAYFEANRHRWRDCGLPPEEAAWIERSIEASVAGVKRNPRFGRGLPFSLYLDKVKQDAYSPVYAAQSLVSTWIGDTRLVTRKPAISLAQVEELRAKLRPGDIILERRNWYLSNAFLPGFWPHGALYVGTPDDLLRLGLHDEPAVKAKWAGYAKPAHDGEPRVVIESISDGVVFSSLREAAWADYIAVLRPRASEAEIRQAILTAFEHQGKPYDFEFDFASSDKLVCTELVYRSWAHRVKVPLVKVMGRQTLPAVEIARAYARDRGTPRQQLDFVLFLDALPGGREAAWRAEDDFCASAERPRAFNE